MPSTTNPDDIVLLISQDRKRFYTRLRAGHQQHTHLGIIDHDDIIGHSLGREIKSHTGHTYVVLEPSLSELMKEVNRSGQIVYPKEAGRIVFKLNVFPGRRIIEAGSGSGALTLALARFVSPDGRVYSYEWREDMLKNAQANVEKAGLSDFVDFKLHDIADGFEQDQVDAVFLDVKEPWRFLHHAKSALKPSGFLGAIVPTTNQISELLIGLKAKNFSGIEVEENFIRRYKPIPGRLRPDDMMVGHTGYLIFARNIEPEILPQRRRKR